MRTVAGNTGDIQSAKGSYVLLIGLSEEQSISVGSLELISFPGSYYAYVGSALNGIEPRLKRHLRKEKKLHWHIDYLLQEAVINNIIVCRDESRIECLIAQALDREFDSVSGFGSSDCRCPSHLFYCSDEQRIKEGVISAMNLINRTGDEVYAQTYSDMEA